MFDGARQLFFSIEEHGDMDDVGIVFRHLIEIRGDAVMVIIFDVRQTVILVCHVVGLF